MYGIGAMGFVIGSGLATLGSPEMIVLGLVLNSLATVVTFVCFNAYVLDYIARVELGKCETLRMFYSALGWTVGPMLGVLLWEWWKPAPVRDFGRGGGSHAGSVYLSAAGNGKQITRAQSAPVNPLAFLGRFLRQPRLIAGWLFAVIRSCGWWAYVVYLPIFAVENGLGETLGGTLLSITNAGLFLSPVMLRWMQKHSVRRTVQTGFMAFALLFCAASLVSVAPSATVGLLFAGSFFLILLDICAGLPFLMAVKPSERTEMSAVYSSLPGCLRHPDTGRGMADPVGRPDIGHFCRCRCGKPAGLGDCRAAASALGENRMKPVKPLQIEQRVLFHET